jgi:hypothetical protein
MRKIPHKKLVRIRISMNWTPSVSIHAAGVVVEGGAGSRSQPLSAFLAISSHRWSTASIASLALTGVLRRETLYSSRLGRNLWWGTSAALASVYSLIRILKKTNEHYFCNIKRIVV